MKKNKAITDKIDVLEDDFRLKNNDPEKWGELMEIQTKLFYLRQVVKILKE